jgi:hypothetical protein
LNLLISGPAASGKSRAALERFQSQANRLLIVPTATMAEHTRHALSRSEARSGFPVRPREIRTLAHCLEEWSPDGPAPAPLLDLLIERALEELRPERFAGVSGFPGFRRALANLFEESPKAVLPADLAALEEDVERNLEARGLGLRHSRLRSAAPAVLPANVILDGFFTLSAAETELILALGERTSVTITLPDWPGSQAVRKTLLSGGFEEHRLSSACRSSSRIGFSAATIEREAEEIARRILAYAAQGRSFREMGIVLRSRDPYAGLVETTLARFGIPARFYFHQPLGSHPALTFLTNVMRAMSGGMSAGWDHAMLLAAVRMPVSGLGATAHGDDLDFAWRNELPAFGLPLPAGLERLAALDRWSRERLEPLEWASRLKALRALLPAPRATGHGDRDEVVVLRSTSAALAAFDEVLEGAASALDGIGRCALPVFWKHVETALALEPLRVPDARRNVVHVMDAYEARQWELPIVFVCGLVERHFPKYHREDPILGDTARRLAGLDTAADRQAEERFLFELATSRATEETILSYPRFDEQGEDTLPSLFLEKELPAVAGRAVVPRVRPKVEKHHGESRQFVHKTLSPTGIESFLQCPFQFFASKTLRLRRRPPQPRDRLDLLVQGSILHRALAEWTKAPLLGSAILNEIFEEECARLRVPEGYRTEAVRLELMRHFMGFLDDTHFSLRSWSTRVEEKFNYALNPLVSITGRIDRLDVGPDDQALVIDYKYSAGNKIKERVEDTSGGHLVQGGLYLGAAVRTFGLDPIGMLFCGLKKDVTWDGWHVSIPGLEALGTSSTREFLRALIDDAERAAVRVHEAITSGDIAVRPTDPRKCRWCDFCDICRVESAVLAKVAS